MSWTTQRCSEWNWPVQRRSLLCCLGRPCSKECFYGSFWKALADFSHSLGEWTRCRGCHISHEPNTACTGWWRWSSEFFRPTPSWLLPGRYTRSTAAKKMNCKLSCKAVAMILGVLHCVTRNWWQSLARHWPPADWTGALPPFPSVLFVSTRALGMLLVCMPVDLQVHLYLCLDPTPQPWDWPLSAGVSVCRLDRYSRIF